MNQIILASASPRRRELLYQIGWEPEIVPSHIEETVTKTEPDQVVLELSCQKAEDVAKAYKGETAIVIGADTVVALDGKILGKPHSKREAAQMLTSLSGREHQVYTGVTAISCKTGKRVSFAEMTRVWVYPITQAEILSYIDTGEPMDKAGAYGIQGRFAAFIREIKGDYTNVVGLPVGRVYQAVKDLEAQCEESH